MTARHSCRNFEAKQEGNSSNKEHERRVVSWIPGWDTVASAGWWSGFYFWISIGCLIGLGIAEVASHRYGDRKDELTAIEETAKDKRHDEDMARVQHDTARATERAAQLEREAAAANERAAEIMKATAWRQFTPDQISELTAALTNQTGKYVLAWIANDPESLLLALQFNKVLESFPGKWDMVNSAKVYSTAVVWGIRIPDVPDAMDTVNIFRRAFTQAGIPFTTEPLPAESMAFGIGGNPPDRAVILFGSRRPTLAQPPN